MNNTKKPLVTVLGDLNQMPNTLGGLKPIFVSTPDLVKEWRKFKKIKSVKF